MLEFTDFLSLNQDVTLQACCKAAFNEIATQKDRRRMNKIKRSRLEAVARIRTARKQRAYRTGGDDN